MSRYLLPMVLLLTGCLGGKSLPEAIDNKSFEVTGGTIFSDPSQLTTKELHFDTGHLLGKQVIIEGEIITTGKYFTYLVINDESGRMLVVLTHLEDAEEILKKKKPRSIKILGTVERGKKGLPYVLARSINPLGRNSKS